MKFLALDLGIYDCGGARLHRITWVDPARIVGVRAKSIGRHDAVLMLAGCDDIEVNMPPEQLVGMIVEAEQDHGTKS